MPPPPPDTPLPELPARAFAKADRSRDALFYAEPRFVTHIDEGAVAAVTGLYRDLFPPGGAVLDLMSSWVSHLPGEVEYAEVVGHGMNAEELAANPRLARWFVRDLNAEPTLAPEVADDSLDAAGCCASVQYLQRPVEVFREVARGLRPGAPFAVTFSDRCFPTKAVAVWGALDGPGRCALVSLYLERAGFAGVEARALRPERRGWGAPDPLYAVVGRSAA